MDVLILGGTAFLGRQIARRLHARGHAVTCLARGSQPAPAGSALVTADRDDPAALSSVAGRAWDAVIDLTSQPVHASGAARELSAKHWVYVSSISVYADFSAPGLAESAKTHAPLEGPRMREMSEYGPAKVACENTYGELDDPVTIIRPGLIGGEGDWTGRSGYYPWRCAHPTGPDVLVPDGSYPTAILDVRDLAAWIGHCIEQSICGIYNVAGQATTLTEVYQHSQDLAGSEAAIRVVDDQTLLREGIQPWAGPRSLPLWLPDPSLRFMSVLDCSAARAEGFRTRPLAETLAAALRYEEQRDVPRQAGLSELEEEALRRALG